MSGIPILTGVPSSITAGDTVKWSKSFSDFLASDGWIITYYFANTSESFSVAGTAYQTNDHLFNLAGSDTENLTAGTFNYEAYAAKGSERSRVECGTLELEANFATGNPVDDRTQVKRTLDAINALLENKASADQQEVEVLGKKLKKMDIAELLKWQSKYEGMYRTEQAACNIEKGLGSGQKLSTRFVKSQ